MSTQQTNSEIFNLIDEGVIVIEDGVIVKVNDAVLGMTGKQRSDLIQQPLGKWIDPVPEPVEAPVATATGQNGAAGGRHESTLKQAQGRRRDVAVSVHGIPNDARCTAIVIVRDIAERKKMQKDLIKSRQLESIAALSGGIAHDYNNLLTAIMGNISLSMTAIAEDDPIYDWLHEAQDAAMIAKELTNRLITFSKGGAPQKETVDIGRLIESATEFALSGSNISVTFTIDQNLWCADVDRTQIGQAFHNIVINAREAMPEGGELAVRAENTRSLSDGKLQRVGRFVTVSIEDNGEGIPAGALDRIFDPYFSTKEMGDQRGMGLGLSIANSIIEKHDGRIVVEDSKEAGALFRVFLPASAAICENPAIPEEPSNASVSVIGGKVLVMDDEAMIRKLAGNMLGKLGFETVFACNGEEALAAYENAMRDGRPFDAVILDLTVKGGMGGKDTIRQLRRLDPDVKAIVSSGYSNDPGVTHFSDYGFCGVVAKPYRFDEIRQQLEEIVG